VDWIERYLGINPDGGNGMVEWALLALAAGLLIEVGRRVVRRLRARETGEPAVQRIRR
jgi:hypothetical protein